MKKYFISLMFAMSCFFLCDTLNAKAYDVLLTDGTAETPLPTPYDTKVFNYYEEQRLNTPFYNLLTEFEDNESLSLYLNSLTGYLDSSNYFPYSNVSIFTKEEIRDYCNYYNLTSLDFCSVDYSTYTHAIIATTDNNNSGLRSRPFFSLTQYNNSLVLSQYFTNSAYAHNSVVHYFNDANFVNSKVITIYQYETLLSKYEFSYNWIKTGWWIFGSSSYGGTDFSYLLGKIYSSNYEIRKENIIDDINLQNLIIKGLGYTDLESSSNKYLKLDYYKDNYLLAKDITKPMYSFLTNLDYDSSIPLDVPQGYLSQSFSEVENLSLFPINQCSLIDYSLYVYSDSSKNITLFLHDITDNDELAYQASYHSIYKTSKDKVLKINPLYRVTSALKIDDEGNTIQTSEIKSFLDSDFIKFFYRLQGFDNKSNFTVYYNSQCYTKSFNYEDVTFINPSTGNEVTYDDNYTNWTDPENVGSGNSASFDFGIDYLLNESWNGLKGILSAGTVIVTMATTLFINLPSEIHSILLSIFSIGAIIIIFKVIR